jgi:hypothetical protein
MSGAERDIFDERVELIQLSDDVVRFAHQPVGVVAIIVVVIAAAAATTATTVVTTTTINKADQVLCCVCSGEEELDGPFVAGSSLID